MILAKGQKIERCSENILEPVRVRGCSVSVVSYGLGGEGVEVVHHSVMHGQVEAGVNL